MIGKIFDIKRFAVHDGPGIRTTVFLKGCPLRCVWCHNPEGISFKPELQFIRHKCSFCGLCAKICPNDAHKISNGHHTLDRKKCTKCGLCCSVCPTNALNRCFIEIDSDKLTDILLEDTDFYGSSNGGVTFSGGECLCQADFCAEVMKNLKKTKIHCAVDTCGYTDKSSIDKVLAWTDLFLYDLKHIDNKKHIEYTGRSNEPILENIKYIDSLGKDIEVRIPVIPALNDYAVNDMALFLKNLRCLKRVKLLSYNNLAESKYANLGIHSAMPCVSPPSHKTMEQYAVLMRKYGINAVSE